MMRHDEIPNIPSYSDEELKEQFHAVFDDMTNLSNNIDCYIMAGLPVSDRQKLAYDNSKLTWKALNDEMQRQEEKIKKCLI